MEAILIEQGAFKMGSNDGLQYESPAHSVTISKSFYMGRHVVTLGQYDKFCEATGMDKPKGGADGIKAPYNKSIV